MFWFPAPSDGVDPKVLVQCQQPAVTWAPVLRAHANAERLLITLWLAGSTCSVRDLKRVTELGQSLVSRPLRELRDAGLVSATAEGRSNRYARAHPDLDSLATLLGSLDAAPTSTK